MQPAWLNKYGVSGYYDVILDNPFEEEKDVLETLRVLRQIPKPFQLQLFTLTFYKGTDIYRMMQEKMGEKGNITIKNYFNYQPHLFKQAGKDFPAHHFNTDGLFH